MLWLFLACKGEFSLDASDLDIGFTEPSVECIDRVSQLMVTQDIQKDPRLEAESFIFIEKESRKMGLYRKGKLVDGGCWRIALGFESFGHKQREGDGKTPEGWYITSDKPNSTYEGAIAIHYPNPDDIEQGVLDNRISRAQGDELLSQIQRGEKPEQSSPLGGEILIHGGGTSTDWTLGCIAMSNRDLKDLRSQLNPEKTADILILP
ncbi:MAG: L,D-transpeptidase family protein [Myxococcota bacterium]|nr:L,D-transpeptidase family protein [Myxococcota bacterium]